MNLELQKDIKEKIIKERILQLEPLLFENEFTEKTYILRYKGMVALTNKRLIVIGFEEVEMYKIPITTMTYNTIVQLRINVNDLGGKYSYDELEIITSGVPKVSIKNNDFEAGFGENNSLLSLYQAIGKKII